MKKIHIIILAVAGIASFAGAFGVTSFFKKNQSDAIGETIENQQVGAETNENPTVGIPSGPTFPDDSSLKKKMLEDQLRNLIFDVRETMKDHKNREGDLVSQEERMRSARQTLGNDIERLSKLHDQFKLTISDLKAREERLKNTLKEISGIEKANLIRIAATYDKMDVTYASKIMINMASTQQLDDAVKIIYLMSERTAAKLLGEISVTKPELACLLSTELKKVKESE